MISADIVQDLFAYGTLMCEDIMEEASGYRLPCVVGMVWGYSRRAVKGEHYPALVPDVKGCVEGVVYRNVPVSAWDRLDRFEGEMYMRQCVRIELKQGTTLLAATYVVQPPFVDYLEASEWHFPDFLRNGKALFRKNYRGYRQIV